MRSVIRGGSWRCNARDVRTVDRYLFMPTFRDDCQGFRVVEDIGRDRCRVVRGGSWSFIPWELRSEFRCVVEPGFCNGYLGFRITEDM